jgi:hypothetical protein
MNDARHLAERDGIATGRLGLAPDSRTPAGEVSGRRASPHSRRNTSEEPVFGKGRVGLDQKGRNKHG